MKWTNPLECLKLSDEDEEDGDVVETTMIELQWEDRPLPLFALFHMVGILIRR